MAEKLSLISTSLVKNENNKIKSIVIMLHGYGSNGNDLISLAREWQYDLPHCIFIAPNAPFEFKQFPGGFKWFEAYPDGVHIDKASADQKLNVKKQFENSCQLIINYIQELSKEYNVKLNKIFLLGFSQGSMISLEVGTKFKESLAGIISLSGRIYSKNFVEGNRKVPILVIHGSDDEIISPKRYYETCKILEENNYNFEKYLINNMGHSINVEVSEIAKNFIKSNQ